MFTPKQLGRQALDPAGLRADKQSCRHFGPCGAGEKALYLNSFFLDRRYYLPFESIQRVFKRVAMSKGGFTGKGLFGSIPYLVVQYDSGAEIQCNFKQEGDVDLLLAHLEKTHPEIPRLSEAAERRLAEREAQEAARYLKTLSPDAQAAREQLEAAQDKLAEQPELTAALAKAAKSKRVSDQSNPTWKWVALAIMLAGVAALAYGVFTLISGDSTGLYFTLFGLAAAFLFSGAQVLPTARNSRKAVDQAWADSQQALKEYVGANFPIPYWYAHPIVLERMIRILREGRAQTVPQALEALKSDLKALNAGVQVEQAEYDEVVCIKPLFLLRDYQ